MVRGILALCIVLVLFACSSGPVENTSTVPAAAVPTTSIPETATTLHGTTTTVSQTSTTIPLVPEWVVAVPYFGVPGEPLEICGVVRGADLLSVVVTHPDTGHTWPDTARGTVVVRREGSWCWVGEFPGEMQDQGGTLFAAEPGLYDVDIIHEGAVLLHTVLEISSDEAIASMPPSQSPEEAGRDGIIPEIAALPFPRRVDAEIEVPAGEGDWILSRLTRVVTEATYKNGCRLGDPNGVYPVEVVCSDEYGELLLVVDGEIVKAYPMPGAPPSWIHIADDFVYGGHTGDGGLPNSTLVRIDRETLEATIVVIPSSMDGGGEWLPAWHVAPVSLSPAYWDAVHINSRKTGTHVESWIGEFDVDLDAIDDLIDTVTTSTFVWPPGTRTCAEVDDDLPVGVDDHALWLDQGLVSFWRPVGTDGSAEEAFIQFVDDPTCTAGSAAWTYLIGPILDVETLNRHGELCDFYASVQESDLRPDNAATVLDHLAEAEELCR